MDLQGTGGGLESDPSLDEKQLLAFIDRKLEECRQTANRTSNESIWLTNTAWLLGYTNVYWDASARVFRNVDAAIPGGRRQKLQTNRILSAIHNRTARLTKNPPRYDVRPNSMEAEDKDAARLGKMILEHYWAAQNLSRKRIDLTMWKQQCGHAYLKVCWDTELGRRMTDPMTGEVQNEGDVRIDIATAFEVYPDPGAKTMEDISWLIQTKIRPLSYFRDQYPEKGALVKEETTHLMGLQYEQRINTMNARSDGDGTAQQVKNSAVEKVYYEKASKKHPNGRMIISANGVLLEDKELPCGEIPFVKFDDIIVGGKFYGEAIITHLRPIQEQINRIINQRNDWIKKLLAGKYTAPRGAGLAQEAMDDQSGEIVEYDPVPNAPEGGRPVALQVPMIPQYAYTEEDRLVEALFDIAGVSEISRGQLPAAGIPAVGMQILLEADDTRIALITAADEMAWAKLGQLILKYVQKYVTEERLLKVSSNQGYLVKSFVGADLRGNDDVIVIKGSTIPNSAVIKRQDILNLYERGLLGDPADPAVREKVLSMLEFGQEAEAWKDRALDEMQVKKAIESIEQGVFDVIVSEFDNHTYWLQELNRYRKSDKWAKLSPGSKIFMNQVMEECIRYLMPSDVQNPPAPMPEDSDGMAAQPPMMSEEPPEEGVLPQ